MPTVLRSGAYRFYFYSHEPNEPPHVHVDRDDLSAKFWLKLVQLAANFGFRAHELSAIQSIVELNREQLLQQWHEFFGF
jgi:tRNA(Phe) wybutosine-synthesizing methylase Tyw3